MDFYVRQEKFEGPLDLLLELITKEKLAITDISLGSVADEFLARVKGMDGVSQKELGEFLVVAAQLLLIKSNALLPHIADKTPEDAGAGDLTARLKEYQKFRTVTAALQKCEAGGRRILTRVATENDRRAFSPPPSCLPALLSAALTDILLSRPERIVLPQGVIRRVVSLEEKMKHVQRLLADSLQKNFGDIVGMANDKMDIIVSFLAILELARKCAIVIDQDRSFGRITMGKADATAEAI